MSEGPDPESDGGDTDPTLLRWRVGTGSGDRMVVLRSSPPSNQAPAKTSTLPPPRAAKERITGPDVVLGASPRPRENRVTLELLHELRRGLDAVEGPNSWIFLTEPTLGFGAERASPDLAAWERERLPTMPDGSVVTVVPGWVCEVTSPDTSAFDRTVKLPRYLRGGVRWLWLVDPARQRVEALYAEAGAWRDAGYGRENAVLRAAPFDQVSVALGRLWAW